MFARTFRRKLAWTIIAGVAISFAVIGISRAAGSRQASPFPIKVWVTRHVHAAAPRKVDFTFWVLSRVGRAIPIIGIAQASTQVKGRIYHRNLDRWQGILLGHRLFRRIYTLDLSTFPDGASFCFWAEVGSPAQPGSSRDHKCVTLKAPPLAGSA